VLKIEDITLTKKIDEVRVFFKILWYKYHVCNKEKENIWVTFVK
jgi:hypothetical protein